MGPLAVSAHAMPQQSQRRQRNASMSSQHKGEGRWAGVLVRVIGTCRREVKGLWELPTAVVVATTAAVGAGGVVVLVAVGKRRR